MRSLWNWIFPLWDCSAKGADGAAYGVGSGLISGSTRFGGLVRLLWGFRESDVDEFGGSLEVEGGEGGEGSSLVAGEGVTSGAAKAVQALELAEHAFDRSP